MQSMPIMRLELQGMKHTILKAFSAFEMDLDRDVRHAVEAYCTSDTLSLVLGEIVEQVLTQVVREEVERFYRHGAGRATLRDAVWRLLQAQDSERRDEHE